MFNLSKKNILQGLVTILFINQLLWPTNSYSQTITFAVDDYCPYYCKNKEKNAFEINPGFVIEILNLAFKKAGIETKYIFVPWERGLYEVNKNTINGIIVSSKKNAPELTFPEQEQGSSIGCFVKQKASNWQFLNRNSLNDIRLGVIKNYDYSAPVDNFIWQYHKPDKQVTFIAGENQLPRLLHMIVKNRIDATIDDINVLRHTIKQHNLEQEIVSANCTQEKIKLYVGFSPKNPNGLKYANILSKAMINLRESGTLSKILAKYNVTDWQ